MSYDITVNQGATYSLMITIKDPLGVAIDLTGHLFRGQIRSTYGSDKIQASFNFTLQPQAGLTLGKVLAQITADETAAIEVDPSCQASRKITKMIYDIESDLSGSVTRWLEGTAFISPEVTR